MARYRYKFENILKLRKSIEDNKKNLLSQSIKKLNKEKKELDALSIALFGSIENANKKMNEGIRVKEIIAIANEHSYYRDKIEEKKVSLKDAKTLVDNRMEELSYAMKDRKIMERLKEINYNKYKYEEERKAEKNLDEIISFKTNYKVMEGK